MVQATLALGPSVLGAARLAMGAGALVGIPLSGRVTARLGSRRVVAATMRFEGPSSGTVLAGGLEFQPAGTPGSPRAVS